VLDSSVKSTEVMEELVGAPTLGAVAFEPAVAARPLIVQEATGSPRAEAYRRIRTNLQFVDVDRPPRVITVNSSLPGEGKTTTACNLAITLAQSGRRVALVDADLRRPKVAQYLGLEGAVGLTSVLIDHTRLGQALQLWGPDRIGVLTSGAIPPNPSELLASQHMVDLLAQLETRWDFVILDTPPLLAVTDAAVLASRCDGALLVVRHGRTTRHQVQAATAALKAVSARPVGVVLNMTPKRRGGSYGYGYGYYEYESSHQDHPSLQSDLLGEEHPAYAGEGRFRGERARRS
jgi:non-specific protein-tyrosine kinase